MILFQESSFVFLVRITLAFPLNKPYLFPSINHTLITDYDWKNRPLLTLLSTYLMTVVALVWQRSGFEIFFGELEL